MIKRSLNPCKFVIYLTCLLFAQPGHTSDYTALVGQLSSNAPKLDKQVLESALQPDGKVTSAWVPRTPLPREKGWFETAWAEFNRGDIYT